MARCSNCGKRIPEGAALPLCARCAKCTNLYEAQLQRLRRAMGKAVRSGLVSAAAAVAVHLLTTAAWGSIVSTMLFYYAAASVLLSFASCLSTYIQLRLTVRREQKEAENAPQQQPQ